MGTLYWLDLSTKYSMWSFNLCMLTSQGPYSEDHNVYFKDRVLNNIVDVYIYRFWLQSRQLNLHSVKISQKKKSHQVFLNEIYPPQDKPKYWLNSIMSMICSLWFRLLFETWVSYLRLNLLSWKASQFLSWLGRCVHLSSLPEGIRAYIL